MSAPTCPPAERWQQHLAGSLPDAEQADLVRHLGDCAACQQTLQTLAGGESLLDVAREVGKEAAEPVPARVIAGLKEQASARETRAEPPPVNDVPLDFLLPSDQPGSLGRLGHYEFIEVVGRGGMGVVFRAQDTRLSRVVAIKVLARQLAASGVARQRFLCEARAAAAVCHDHVVAIYAVEEAQGFPFLVMQYVPGVSLEGRLRRSGALPVREVLRIGMQTAAGLAAAHAQGLVHRDIKPANILLENGVERVKITDFGLARAAEDVHLTQPGCLAGTPTYMSPEQADGQVADQRSDLFSLGSVLYEMCAGCPPFRGPTRTAVLRAVAEASPRPVRALNPEVPASLAEVIGKLHARAPEARYQSAAEVASALGQMLAELQQSAPDAPPARPQPTDRRWVRRPRVLALGLAGATFVLLASLVVAFVLWRPRGPGGENRHPQPTSVASVEVVLPANLMRMARVIDDDWSKAAPGFPLGTDERWKITGRYAEGALICQFDRCLGADWRRWPPEVGPSFLRTACCLTGRVRAKEQTALAVCLFGPEGHGAAVQARSDGLLVVSPAMGDRGWQFARAVGSWKQLARPDGQPNDLLVVLQNRRLRVFVNDQECDFSSPVNLPEEVVPAQPRCQVYCWGPGEARVDLIRWRVWDLDHPVFEDEKTRGDEKKPPG
jgi:serine/threonine-protein kinase